MTTKMKKVTLLSLLVVVAAMFVAGCKKKENEPTPDPKPVAKPSVEKQWLVDGPVKLNLMGNHLYTIYFLFDISVTEPGYMICGMKNDTLAKMFKIPAGFYFYGGKAKIVITPKDDKSGIITAMVKDSVDNYQEEQMLYEDLTENSITLIGIDRNNSIKDTMKAKAANTKIGLKYVGKQ